MGQAYHPITERITELWKELGYKNETAFWTRLPGISRTSVINLKKKKAKGYPPPSTEVIIAVAIETNANLNWVVLGKGEMLLPQSPIPMDANYAELLTRVLLRAETLEAEIEKMKVELKSIKEMSADVEPVKKHKRRAPSSHEAPHSTDG